MAQQLITVGEIRENYTATGRLSGYLVEVHHNGLNEHKVLKDQDDRILRNKLQAQLRQWDTKWQARVARVESQRRRASGAAGAEEATKEAQAALRDCHNILSHTLQVSDRVDWSALRDSTPFIAPPVGTPGIEYNPRSGRPERTHQIARPSEPSLDLDQFAPKLGLLRRILPGMRASREAEAQARARSALNEARAAWQAEVSRADAAEKQLRESFAREQTQWTATEREHLERQREANAVVDGFQQRYLESKRDAPDAVAEHAELVLNASAYPEWLEIDFELGYSAESGTLVVDYQLPDVERVPNMTEVTYVAARDDFRTKTLTKREHEDLFDSICYQIALRTIHELFEADEIDAIDAVVFNGWVEMVDRGTGTRQRPCILTVRAGRQEFEAINLAEVDPKACFKRLKGVAAARLAGLAPVAPVMQLDKDDRRFVDPQDIGSGLAEGTNLATIPWEDFEHLVRELFEKEFAATGGEVRVTQASRDGGVDAVIFDPDPLRGGKIVVQAKRYSNTVGVSAVRDLYGTVMNEGANKGILVTTSDYGPDAYDFIQGKPLTLLSGSNLLFLLEKHGHKARIDLQEAKQARVQ